MNPTPYVPRWLTNLGAVGWRVLVAVALLAVLAYLALVIATVTASILVSLIVAATFAPFVLGLRARGWSRARAAATVTFGALLVIGAGLLLIALALIPYVPQVAESITSALARLTEAMRQANLSPDVASSVQAIATGIRDWISTSVATLVASVATLVTVGLLSLFTTFFLLADGDKGWVWLLQAASDWQKSRINSAGDEALARVGGYLRGLAILSAVNAGRDYLLLVLLGVPLAGPLAVLVFILGFIPYFGGLIATGLIVLVTWAATGVQGVAIFLAAITLLNLIERNVLVPLVYGKTVEIHPAVALLAMLVGGVVAGVVGVFIAIPVVAFVSATATTFTAVLGSPDAPRTGVVPAWLDELAQWSWRILVGIGLLALIVVFAEVATGAVVPPILGLVIASTLVPLVRLLVARGWSRGPAAALATLGSFGVVVGLMVLCVIVMIPQLADITAASSSAAESVDASTGSLAGPVVGTVQTFGVTGLLLAAATLTALGAIAIVLIVTMVLCFYFLKDGPRVWGAAIARVQDDRRELVDAAGSRVVSVLGGYMIATGAVSLVGAASQWLIMTLLGIPLALPLGVLAFFGGFIPYIGSLLTTGAALLVTIATGSQFAIAVMLGWTVVFNIVQGNVVGPLVYGRAVHIHPAVIILAVPAANEVAGILGMFLVVPFLGVLAAVWRPALRVAEGAVSVSASQSSSRESGVPVPLA